MTSKVVFFAGTVLGAGLASCHLLGGDVQFSAVEAEKPPRGRLREAPTRRESLESLRTESFDVVIIGGGASGAGCALDAVTRGLKTALVESDDFASGTSSRSTKLIHGGVRYLQKAIVDLDYEQYRMVKEALRERACMLRQAPHLARPLPILLPVYKLWQAPYFWAGIKAYDLVAGRETLKSSYFISRSDALEAFPMLRPQNLVGGIVYYDGLMDDARMNLAIALTATRRGATVANHVSAVGLAKRADGSISGVLLRDEASGRTWTAATRCVVNATGPLADAVRRMDDPAARDICRPSSGVHVVLPGYYCPEGMGLLDPATGDGRVVFFLPWHGRTIAGTTDLPCEATRNPKPTEEEISFILGEIRRYLAPDLEVRRGDVLSAWSGIRPLVSDPDKPDTQSLARNHVVHVSESGLVTIAGGKWTTYRSMAADAIDAAIKACDLKPMYRSCRTDGLRLVGADAWTPTMYIRLVQDFGLELDVARHLADSYGGDALDVAKMAARTGKRWPVVGKRIHPEFPYIEAEIRHGVTAEYAMTAVDVIARRLRLAFLNAQAAQDVLPRVVDVMAAELGWSEAEKQRQIDDATRFLRDEMGLGTRRSPQGTPPGALTEEDVQCYTKRFRDLDGDDRGYVSVNDVRASLKSTGLDLSDDQMHLLQSDIDVTVNGQLRLDEYLQMMAAIKSGSRLERIVEREEGRQALLREMRTSVERSGGGL